ncbi:hypothetical protein [Azospirillum halopraeferens]|uniref:hypothetical protein n=1 Tax=Azospirillum halopraeferens TaxID=34010 RepID=UPI00054F7B00|nr:hypothetical protein [Azospirillum halopraeferens]
MPRPDLRAAWTGLCRFLKDDSYERYLAEHARLGRRDPPMDLPAFRRAEAMAHAARMCCDD